MRLTRQRLVPVLFMGGNGAYPAEKRVLFAKNLDSFYVDERARNIVIQSGMITGVNRFRRCYTIGVVIVKEWVCCNRSESQKQEFKQRK